MEDEVTYDILITSATAEGSNWRLPFTCCLLTIVCAFGNE